MSIMIEEDFRGFDEYDFHGFEAESDQQDDEDSVPHVTTTEIQSDHSKDIIVYSSFTEVYVTDVTGEIIVKNGTTILKSEEDGIEQDPLFSDCISNTYDTCVSTKKDSSKNAERDVGWIQHSQQVTIPADNVDWQIAPNETHLCLYQKCKKTFPSFSQLTEHMSDAHKIHRNYICKHCSKAFCSQRSLVNHIALKHSTKKSVKCTLCGHSFCSKYIIQHMKVVHFKHKPLKCDTCGVTFAYERSLKQHKAAVHEGKKLYSCNYCKKSFGWQSNLNTHIKLYCSHANTV